MDTCAKKSYGSATVNISSPTVFIKSCYTMQFADYDLIREILLWGNVL